MSNFYIGVDPGASGGVVVLRPDNNWVALKPPTDDDTIKDFSKSFYVAIDVKNAMLNGYKYHIYLEDTHAISGDYVNKAHSFGYYKGLVHALVSTLTGHSVVNMVSPQTWQQFYKTTKATVDRKQHKKDLYNQAVNMHGEIHEDHKIGFKKVTNWNADAFLIACYAFYKVNVGSD